MNADGSSPRRLTSHPAADVDPAWSPDGTRIAFASERDKNAEIYVMNADGSGVVRVTTNETWDGHPTWSPDGRRIAFVRTLCTDEPWGGRCYQGVMVLGPTGSEVEVGVGEEPAWSPDGRQIAVTRFMCDLYFYYYGPLECTVAGIGILVPFTTGAAGSREAWDHVLTRGEHRNPSWRP